MEIKNKKIEKNVLVRRINRKRSLYFLIMSNKILSPVSSLSHFLSLESAESALYECLRTPSFLLCDEGAVEQFCS